MLKFLNPVEEVFFCSEATAEQAGRIFDAGQD
jgi:hypothetical protein